MAARALSLPLDITWQRLAYARDMLDTDFAELALSPKWRSSMAVYGYVVPEEQTAESYPDARIVYLRLTCSITGWNVNEELREAVQLSQAGSPLDDGQASSWEAIQSDGWARTYWPCRGAIAQVAVYPGREDAGVQADDFPYILDFEPKKRELYETASTGNEFLSGSSEKLAVQKGTTTLDHTEKSVSGGFTPSSLGGWGIQAGVTKSNDTTTIDNRTTDTSREDRETKSFTTTFSQMYQLFNGYHLGTNRALFVISPRPHIASDGPGVDFNLIRGERKLEGIQDMFLVVHVPKQLRGLCLQASLDTGHDVEDEPGIPLILHRDPDRHRNGEDERLPPDRGGIPPPDGGPDETEESYLVVTRRVVRNCAQFTEDGRFVLVGAPGENNGGPRFPDVVFEAGIGEIAAPLTLRRLTRGRSVLVDEQVNLANQFNLRQSKVLSTMLSGFSAGRYRTRRFVDTHTFRVLMAETLGKTTIEVEQFARQGVLTKGMVQTLRRAGIASVADLFRRDDSSTGRLDRQQLVAARRAVLNHVTGAARRPK